MEELKIQSSDSLSPWDTYPVFDMKGYQVPFIPFLRPDQKLINISSGDIQVHRDNEPFILPREFQKTLLDTEIDESRNDCCRLEDVDFNDNGKLSVTIRHTTYADFLKSGEHLDDLVPDNKKETFRERFATLIQREKGDVDLVRFRLTNVCGVGTFILTNDNHLVIRRQSDGAHTYPGRLTFSSSGTVRWRWYPDPFIWAYQNCFERLHHEINREKLNIINFGFDTRKLYFNFCLVEDSNSSSEEMKRNVPGGTAIETVKFWRLNGALDFLLSQCWEPAAEAAYLTLCARKFGGWEKVSKELEDKKNDWGRHFMHDEWDYRASRRGKGDLPVTSVRYDPEKRDDESRHFAERVSEFIGNEINNKTVVDIGAGNGRITQHLIRSASSIICIDLCEKMLLKNKERLGIPLSSNSYAVTNGMHTCNVTYEDAQFAQDWEPKTKFDVAVCCQVLIHNIGDKDFMGDLIDKLCSLAPVVFVFEDVTIGRKRSPYTRQVTRSQLVEEFQKRNFHVDREDTGFLSTDTIAFLKFSNIATAPPTNQKIDFVLVTALPEERDAVLAKLPGYRKLPPSRNDIRTYFQAELPVTFPDGVTGFYNIIVMPLLGMGRVQAATATTDAIHRWNPRYIMLVGIAGGLAAGKVALGDLLISDQIVDYELQKITDQGTQIRWDVHRATPMLLGACNNFLGESWLGEVRYTRPGSEKPKRHIGPVASGDKVVAFDKILAEYQSVWPKLIGVEMEAAGVATAVFQGSESPGFFMVRGVSDLADENKGTVEVEKWRLYACDIAATFTVAFLKSGPIDIRTKSV
jgi:nucleoside phosphorylase/2-polyprenyl-3-methyl-5-hydroxy-6-metoxy-1,4-benzoquinol methylase